MGRTYIKSFENFLSSCCLSMFNSLLIHGPKSIMKHFLSNPQTNTMEIFVWTHCASHISIVYSTHIFPDKYFVPDLFSVLMFCHCTIHKVFLNIQVLWLGNNTLFDNKNVFPLTHILLKYTYNNFLHNT